MLIIIEAMSFMAGIKFLSFHLSRMSIAAARLRQGVVWASRVEIHTAEKLLS